MPIFGVNSYNGPQESKYLFIDGGCLRAMLSDFSSLYFNNEVIDLNYSIFTRDFTKVFYYDTISIQRSSESEVEYDVRKKQIEGAIEKLELTDRFHVYLGESHKRRKRIEQKQVDIMIAIHMLQHSFHRNMHAATLLSTDSDFIPLLDALVENGMITALWYADTEHCRAKRDLIISADRRMKIGIKYIFESCTELFKKTHSIPREEIIMNATHQGLLHEWNDNDRGPMKLFKEGDTFIVMYNHTEQFNQFNEVKHQDLQILRHYCKDEVKIAIPEF